jgi:hypothetical protein
MRGNAGIAEVGRCFPLPINFGDALSRPFEDTLEANFALYNADM